MFDESVDLLDITVAGRAMWKLASERESSAMGVPLNFIWFVVGELELVAELPTEAMFSRDRVFMRLSSVMDLARGGVRLMDAVLPLVD